jgi:hypothetical protein
MKKAMQILALAAATLALTVSAQTLSGVKLEPKQAKVGESVKLTADLEVKDGITNCGLLFNWGDGTTSYEKVNQAQDAPRIGNHVYAKPGTYTVAVEPTKAGSSLKCGGKDIKTTIVIAAAAAPAPVAAAPAAATPAAATPMAKAGDVCPAGWKLAKPGVSKKTKSYTCTAKANTPLPEAKVACPGDLTYFENMKKGQLGCRV